MSGNIHSPWVVNEQGAVYCSFCHRQFEYKLDPRQAHEATCPVVEHLNSQTLPESMMRSRGRQLLQEGETRKCLWCKEPVIDGHEHYHGVL